MATLEERLRALADDRLRQGDIYALDELTEMLCTAAALGLECAAEVCDRVSVTDFRRLGMGVYSERIHTLAQQLRSGSNAGGGG